MVPGTVQRMCHRRLVMAALGFPLLALAAFAYARPPDPTWVGGLYDNADYDDIVMAVYGMDAAPELPTPPVPKPFLAVIGAVPAGPAELARAPLRASPVRAPPPA